MNKNKYNSNGNKKGVIAISVIAVFILFIGWALLKAENNSPGGRRNNTGGGLDSMVGRPLPAIQLFDKDGNPYSLGDLKGKNAVLFFNEGIICYPACWNQVAQFGADPKFNTSDTVALSVVVDRPEQWQQAIAKMPDLARATLLFDRNSAVSRELGLVNSGSSMHKGSVPGHTYIVLDKQGIVRFVYDDPGMGINNDMIIKKIADFK